MNMMILYNPENGAEIKDVWLKGINYFGKDDDETFKPGMLLQFDQDLGKFLLETFEFLQELDPVQAKQYQEDAKKQYACDKCDFKTKVPVALAGHQRKHEAEAKIEDLHIPKIGKQTIPKEDRPMQDQIDEEANAAGLTGEGLVEENKKYQAIMR